MLGNFIRVVVLLITKVPFLVKKLKILAKS